MENESFKEHPAYKYAVDVCQGNIITGKYIKKVCKRFLEDIEDEKCKYIIDYNSVIVITGLTKLINMATGLCVGKPAYETLSGFQWFFIINALCWKHKDNM